MTATPASGSSFTGWSGACSGTGTCTVALSADRAVTATFKANGPNPNPNTAAPTIKLEHHPSAKLKTKKKHVKVSFTFATAGKVTELLCRMDKGKFARCTSPAKFTVGRGKHAFAVEATGPGGTSKPATFTFKVIRKG